MDPVREARLRPEFAALYPELVPGAWQPARVLAELVAKARRSAAATPADGSRRRVLSDEHFEFRDRPA